MCVSAYAMRVQGCLFSRRAYLRVRPAPPRIFIFANSLIFNLSHKLFHACSSRSRDCQLWQQIREIAESFVTGKRLAHSTTIEMRYGGQDFYNCRGGYFVLRGGHPLSYASPPQISPPTYLKASNCFERKKEIWLLLLWRRLCRPWKHPTLTPHSP
jgi:hypothetical protein